MFVVAILTTLLGIIMLYAAVQKYQENENKVDLYTALIVVLLMTYFPILYLIGGVTHG